jgi:hypothetical protein
MNHDPMLATQSLSLHGQVDQLCDEFETSWRAGQVPDIREFLASHESTSTFSDPIARRLLLHELIKIDLDHRWRTAAQCQPCEHDRATMDGRTSDAETASAAGSRCLLIGNYVELIPELGSLNDLPVELIAEEYRARHRWGDRPDHSIYSRRFMHLGETLRQALEQVDEELGTKKAGLELRVYENQELVYRASFTGPIELGRQNAGESGPYSHSRAESGWRFVIARLDEDTMSRRHAHLEPLGDGRVRITNLSSNRSIILHDGTKLTPGDTRVVLSPVVLAIGTKAVRIRS